MGGFQFFEETPPSQRPVESNKSSLLPPCSRPLHPLDMTTIEELVKEGSLTLPTESEIEDRSKSDWLAKSLVLVQTSWFVIQCISRAAARLPVTELELVTLAYATISFGIYLAWWDKPRNVAIPIRVFKRPDAEGEGEDGEWEDRDSKKDNLVRTITHSDDDASQSGKSRQREHLWTWVTRDMLWEWFISCLDHISGGNDDDINLRNQKNVPMFYSGKPSDRQIAISDIGTVLVGIVFGAIHCIAWSFEFPSHREQVLWRLSSAAIAGVPVACLFAAWCFVLGMGVDWDSDSTSLLRKILAILLFPFVLLLPLLGLLYAVARITSLVLAFLCLRDLPPGAYENIQWTSYIPHI